MNRLLTRLLGRLPIGLLQLVHNKMRFAAALAGIAFANVLVLVQLGLSGALDESVRIPYRQFDPGLILISAADSDSLAEGSNVPRQWLYQALIHPDIAAGTALFVGKATWLTTDGSSASLQVFGFDPLAGDFLSRELAGKLPYLAMENTALADRKTRFVDMSGFRHAEPERPVEFELQNLTLRAVGTFAIGGGFSGDGGLFVSDQTFLRLFPRRRAAAPNHILLAVREGADTRRVIADLKQILPDDSVRVRTVAEASAIELAYQKTERPTGLIFAFGVAIGVLVGIVIAYQVLSTDVADHIREYATFKAMGYRHSFFVGVILEEALILAAVGFWPGLAMAQLFYSSLAHLANIPIFMTAERAVTVFVGTIVASAISGILAMRKLQAADPADLF